MVIAKLDTDGELGNELWVLLHQARDAITRAMQNELRQADISIATVAVLAAAKTLDGPVTPVEISRALFREPHTICGTLHRMESQGLIRRVHDLERKNMVRVEVTELGERSYRRSRKKQRSLDRIMACLTQEESDCLRSSLAKLRNRALRQLAAKRRLSIY